MATVQTVLGPIDSGDLGPTLVHEHVRISYPGDQLDPAYNWDLYDQFVLNAKKHKMAVLFTIYGTPRWANGGQKPNRAGGEQRLNSHLGVGEHGVADVGIGGLPGAGGLS